MELKHLLVTLARRLVAALLSIARRAVSCILLLPQPATGLKKTGWHAAEERGDAA